MDRSELRRLFLHDSDVPCPNCAYNLRGLAGDRCPECNEELELEIRLVEPVARRWLITVCGLAAGAGAAGLLLLGVLILSITFGDFAPAGMFVIPLTWLIVEGFFGAALCARPGRLWFRRQPDGSRTACACAAWAATMLLLIVTVVYIASF